MTRFLDGPAAGVVLALHRAPPFLRVARHRRKRKDPFDALDQLADEPDDREELFCYRRVRKDGPMHLCVRGKNRGASGWYPVADYVYADPQPPEGTMRSTPAWRAWAEAQAKAAAAPTQE